MSVVLVSWGALLIRVYVLSAILLSQGTGAVQHHADLILDPEVSMDPKNNTRQVPLYLFRVLA